MCINIESHSTIKLLLSKTGYFILIYGKTLSSYCQLRTWSSHLLQNHLWRKYLCDLVPPLFTGNFIIESSRKCIVKNVNGMQMYQPVEKSLKCVFFKENLNGKQKQISVCLCPAMMKKLIYHVRSQIVFNLK